MKRTVFVAVLLLAGAGALAGVNGFFAYTNTMDFCTSCHTMQWNYEEYKETVHYKNPSGVKATCADCHVPKEFWPKVKAKIIASKDIYHQIVGTIDTKEKFEEHRWDMANRVWDQMRETDSRTCRNCHAFDDMDLSGQSRIARNKHGRAPTEGKTCIDCHQGVAHHEPKVPMDEVNLDDIQL